MKKKLISAVLALVIVLGLLPMAVFAEGTESAQEANVSVGGTSGTTTEDNDGVHRYTAANSVKLSLVKGGNNVYGYYPMITMPTITEGSYVLLSRGKNNQDEKLTTALTAATATDTTRSTTFPYEHAASSLATWIQVYDSSTWGTSNAPYWPEISRQPVVNVTVATKSNAAAAAEGGDGSQSWTFEKYMFDFSAAKLELPFTVSAAEDANLTTFGQADNFQTGVTSSTTEVSAGLNERDIAIAGTSKWYNCAAFGTDRTEANYVALKFAGKDGVAINKIVVTMSDGTTKKELSSNDLSLLWQFDEAGNNKKISIRVYFGESTSTGSVAYTLDCSSMTLQSKQEENPPASGTALTFAAQTGNVAGFDNKPVSDLGSDFNAVADQTTKTVSVTGSAKYIEGWSAFSDIPAEQSGHFVPIKITIPDTVTEITSAKITVTGSDNNSNMPKEVTGFTAQDKALDLVMRVDDLTGGKFTVKFNNEDAYTVDCSKVTLLPEVTDGCDAEATESGVKVENSSAGSSVEVPKGLNSGELVVSVTKPSVEEQSALSGKIQGDVATEIKTAVSDSSKTKLVEVKVTKDGTELKTAEQLSNQQLTVTISGLQSGKTYFVFSIDSNGDMKSYGYVSLKAGETSVKIPTKHLTVIGATLMPSGGQTGYVEFMNAIKTVAADTTTVEGGHQAATTTPGGNDVTKATWTARTAENLDSMRLDGKVTLLNTTSGKVYLILATNEGEQTAFYLKATSTTLSFFAQNATQIRVYESNTADLSPENITADQLRAFTDFIADNTPVTDFTGGSAD